MKELRRVIGLAVFVAALSVGCAGRREARVQGSAGDAGVQAEFRGVWVASVGNIDWPSRKGLSTERQQEEMIAILDKAVELNLNAIILQVRTSCDALYASELEPWSEFLTGEQGRRPEPYYDPLEMWIAEAHLRGLELHAWLNPYRARTPMARTKNAPTHPANTIPGAVKVYGRYEWLDPGSEEAQRHTLAVFMDVVRRYDIDGIHMDDYFYPYPEKGVDFPDEESWEKFQEEGGVLSRGDWRRRNINRFIETLYKSVKREKRHVKVGISPFGIWRPGYPKTVETGFDQYASLYADAKLWLNKGWCDYFSPQLYWPVASTQPYGDLLAWWIAENKKGRHIWPGNYTSRIGHPTTQRRWNSEELIRQIELTRAHRGAGGNIHFSMKALMENREGIGDALKAGVYREKARVPVGGRKK